MSLSAVGMSSVVPAEDSDIPSSPFENVANGMLNHSYLPTRFGCLNETALVYIAGFVVRQVMKHEMCAVTVWFVKLYQHKIVITTTC